MDDETTDEVEVGVETVLLGELCGQQDEGLRTKKKNGREKGRHTERISSWFLSKLSSVSVERRKTI